MGSRMRRGVRASDTVIGDEQPGADDFAGALGEKDQDVQGTAANVDGRAVALQQSRRGIKEWTE